MTERERLVHLAEGARRVQEYWAEFFPLNVLQRIKWGWKARKYERALTNYDHDHNREAQ